MYARGCGLRRTLAQCCSNAGPLSSMVTDIRPVSSGVGVCRPAAAACVVLLFTSNGC